MTIFASGPEHEIQQFDLVPERSGTCRSGPLTAGILETK